VEAGESSLRARCGVIRVISVFLDRCYALSVFGRIPATRGRAFRSNSSASLRSACGISASIPCACLTAAWALPNCGLGTGKLRLCRLASDHHCGLHIAEVVIYAIDILLVMLYYNQVMKMMGRVFTASCEGRLLAVCHYDGTPCVPLNSNVPPPPILHT
jgi:hypothetical protein